MPRLTIEVSDAPLDRDALDAAAVVAARAFQNDAFFSWLIPKPLIRARGIAILSRGVLSHLGPKGTVLTARVGGQIVGVAGWIGPEGHPVPARVQLGELLHAIRAVSLSARFTSVGLRYILAMEKAHPKEPHWYLALLTTDPSAQRSGVGTALVEPILERCDLEGVDAYLETQDEANLAYYARFGFEVVGTMVPVKGGLPLWRLRRPHRG